MKSIIGNLLFIGLLGAALTVRAEEHSSFKPGTEWTDTEGVHINAHGGGILFYNDTYYWFGEHKTEGADGNKAQVGVRCYSSTDLYNWKNEGVALAVADEGSGSEIEKGCIIERPKVIYNEATGKFVMYFHLEYKGEGYDTSPVGIATSDHVAGPYTYLHSIRPNAGRYPQSYKEGDELFFNIYFLRDFEVGQKSRDMTLFVDEDGKAYHIYSSEDNGTLHIAELSDDYLSYTGVYERMAPGGFNEAPAVFRRGGHYYMITSGCTGWSPNPARMFTATHIMGPWTEFANPCVGTNSHTTFKSQSTYILPVAGRKDAYIYMGDRWQSKNPIDGTYVWLPIVFENGLPVLEWHDEWDLEAFDRSFADFQEDIIKGKRLLASVAVGDGIGEYPQEACDAYRTALLQAEELDGSEDESVIAEAVIALNDEATRFQESKIPHSLNTLEDGDYYIKVENRYYLTNDNSLTNDVPLLLQEEKATDTEAQIFSVMKHPVTGRYKIVSKMDGRNVNENAQIRSDWGENDHQWRTMHIFFNGESYAVRTDGKAGYGGLWKYYSKENRVKASGDMHLGTEGEEYFIFSFEKVDEESSLLEAETEQWAEAVYDKAAGVLTCRGDFAPQTVVHLLDVNGRICTRMSTSGAQSELALDVNSFGSGVYLVRVHSGEKVFVSKFIK